MTDEERIEYATGVMRNAANIAYYPDQAKPPFFQHKLTESQTADEFAYGAAIIAVVYPDFAFSILSFKFKVDYLEGLDLKDTTIEYLGLAGEVELTERALVMEQEILQKFPEIQQFSDEEVMRACAELGIPYAMLIFAENRRTEEEIPILFHPSFIRPGYALGAIQLLAAERLDELTR